MNRTMPLGSRAADALVLLVTAIAALLSTPRVWQMPDTGLDPSWAYAAEYAYLHGLIFGRDFNFTSGPLSFIYTRGFDPSTFVWILISSAHIAAVYLAAVWWSPNRRIAAAAVVGLALICAPLSPDAIFLSLPLAIFFLSLSGSAPFPIVAVLVAGLALPSLAKFSILVMSLPLMCLADATALVRRARYYWCSVIYCVSVLIVYKMSGQPISAIGDFLYGSLDLASGYAQTMGNYWWTSQQTALLITAVVILTTAGALTYGSSDIVLRASCLLALIWVVYLAFKTGNVRLGPQGTTWHLLAVASCFFSLLPVATASVRRFSLVLAGTGMAACILLYHSFIASFDPGALARARVAQLTAQASAAAEWLHPRAYFERLKEQRRQAEKQLAVNAPRDLVGTVGSLPWEFSEIIAGGLQFATSPSLQQYTNYTPRLRALTQQYFAGDQRPANLFIRLVTIDEHYRTTELGLSLPSIFAGYDLVSLGSTLPHSHMQLRRRTTPRAVEMHALEEKTASMGEWVEVPRPGKGGLMIAIRTFERIRGKLLAFLYKQSSFELDLKFASGAEVKSRFFPSLVSDGFLVLPPEIFDPRLFFEAERGFNVAQSNPLVAIRVRPADLAAVGFLPTYVLASTSVTISGRSEHPPSVDNVMLALIGARVIESPDVRMLGDRLLAHAPSKIFAMLPEGKKLSAEIGLFDGAWQSGNPPPMTFAISAVTPKGPELLFERTLDPKNQPADRGSQTISVDLPQSAPGSRGELIFETRPAAPWGWTYWSNLKIMP